MPHSSSSNFPKHDVLLNRENSLPTYEEATERVLPGESGYAAPSAALPTVRQGELGFVEPSAPLQQDHERTNYHYPAAPQSAHREVDIERGITNETMLSHEDPVVREMAQTVLEECRRAKEKREMKKMANILGFFAAFVIALVFIVLKASTSSHR